MRDRFLGIFSRIRRAIETSLVSICVYLCSSVAKHSSLHPEVAFKFRCRNERALQSFDAGVAFQQEVALSQQSLGTSRSITMVESFLDET